MTFVIDFSGRVADTLAAWTAFAKGAQAKGAVGAVRYIRPGADAAHPKCMRPIEQQAYTATGFKVAIIFEETTGNALGGFAQGLRDGTFAFAEGAVHHEPSGRPIYFAVDTQVTAAQMPKVLDYFRGVLQAAGGNPARVGVYGEYAVVEAVLRNNLAAFGWECRAWSGGLWSQKACLYQWPPGYSTLSVAGVACDYDGIVKPDWGQWDFANPAPKPSGPTPDYTKPLLVFPATKVCDGHGNPMAHPTVKLLKAKDGKTYLVDLAADGPIHVAQTKLVKAGVPVTVDGWYGAGSATGIATFQGQKHIHVDGDCGPVTHGYLEAV